MTTDELRQEAEEYALNQWEGNLPWSVIQKAYYDGALPREKRIAELEAQIEKMKCCKEEIIKALKETLDYEWLHAHNGKAKYLYLQTVIDIVNDKFKEIKEK